MKNTKELKDFLNGWKCTDLSTLQYCYKHSDDEFSYKEFIQFDEDKGEFREIPNEVTKKIWEDVDLWTQETINFTKLSQNEIACAISGYYEDLEEVKNLYGESWKQIVVECYFECEFLNY